MLKAESAGLKNGVKMDNEHIEEIFIFAALFSIAGIISFFLGLFVLAGMVTSALWCVSPSLASFVLFLVYVGYKLRSQRKS